ncbi:MAG: nitrogen fixation protein NifH [Anaerolineaceae bacterium]
MTNWKNYIKNNVLDWLLEMENPAVRAQTLTGLLGTSPDDKEVRQACSRELETGTASKILSQMEPGGYWGRPQDFYMRSKYHGTVWSFLLLSEMGCVFSDERYLTVGEFLLSHAQRADNGGFTYSPSTTDSGPRPAALPCLTGNLVWALTMAGKCGDARTQRAAAWLAEYQFLRDGRDETAVMEIPAGMEKSLFESCWGGHTCMMGVVKALKALVVWPAALRTPAMEKAVNAGADFLLRHNLVFSSHDLSRVSKPEFILFGFPLFWRTDALEMLETLLLLGRRDEALRPALSLVLSKQGADGRWLLEQSFNGRMLVQIEKKGKPGKWVTLRSLKVIRLACEAGLML